ncbi:MAG: alpha/beta hydrolase [Thermoguttaceae bacterium]|nr:alpha/beta hydrolase [Thermoguttaceae bacterium]MDW8037608.1 alpha/beta fold hydrolase [Thermoguttaceae bacterium]
MKINKLTIRGCQYAYLDQGHGIPWLFLHGFPLDHRMWLPVVERMSSAVRAVVPDLRGFGQSEATAGVVTMAEFADDLAALLDALKIQQPAVVCGLSMGGYIAFEFYFRHKRRVAGLVLCDTRAAADSPEMAQLRQATAQRVLQEGPAFLADSMLPRLLAPVTFQQQPAIAEQLRQQIQSANPAGVAAAALGMAQRRDMQPLLSEITCPTLVLVGTEDVISPPAEMQAFAQAIPKAKFVTIPDAGHMAPLENPGLVTTAFLEFLDLVASGLEDR